MVAADALERGADREDVDGAQPDAARIAEGVEAAGVAIDLQRVLRDRRRRRQIDPRRGVVARAALGGRVEQGGLHRARAGAARIAHVDAVDAPLTGGDVERVTLAVQTARVIAQVARVGAVAEHRGIARVRHVDRDDAVAARWYVLQRRPSAWQPPDRWLIEHERPAYQRTLWGVPLLDVYSAEQYQRALQATLDPGMKELLRQRQLREAGSIEDLDAAGAVSRSARNALKSTSVGRPPSNWLITSAVPVDSCNPLRK